MASASLPDGVWGLDSAEPSPNPTKNFPPLPMGEGCCSETRVLFSRASSRRSKGGEGEFATTLSLGCIPLDHPFNSLRMTALRRDASKMNLTVQHSHIVK